MIPIKSDRSYGKPSTVDSDTNHSDIIGV